jgi:hypothetical protein
MRTVVCRHALSWRITAPDVSISRLLFCMALCSFFFFGGGVSKYTCDIVVPVSWIPPSAPLSCPREQLPPAFWQADLFILFRHVWWMYMHRLPSLLYGFSIHKWNPLFITCYSYDMFEKFIASFVVSLQKSQSRCHSLCFVHTREHFWNPYCAKLMITSPNCDNLIENIAWNLWKFTWKFSKCKVASFTNFLVNTLNILQVADHFALHLEHLFACPYLNILHHCVTVSSLITYWP